MKFPLLAFLTMFVVAVTSLNSAIAHPTMFSDLTIEQAQEQANKDGKLVVVDFTASWCGPCHKMDDTTWTSEEVETWIKKNAVAVQIDVDKEQDIAKSLSISMMPTVLIYQPKEKKEFERSSGYKDKDALLGWLNQAKDGKTQLGVLKDEFKAVEGKGGKTEVEFRYKLANELLQANDLTGATDQYVWLWQNIMKQYPPMAGVRGSYMAMDMQKLAARDESAKGRFTKLRDEAQDVNRDEWMVLNKVVGDDNKTLEWFDSVKNDETKKHEMQHLSASFKLFLVEKGRFADVGKLCKDPIAEVIRDNEMSTMVKKVTGGYDMFPSQVTILYSCLVAAGRDTDAKAVKEESLKYSTAEVLNPLFAKADESMKKLKDSH